jgi:hypothetical protein
MTNRQLWVLGAALAVYYPVALALTHLKSTEIVVNVGIDAACFILISRGKRLGWWLELIRQGASFWLAIIVRSRIDSGALAAPVVATTGVAAVAILLWIWTPHVPDLT